MNNIKQLKADAATYRKAASKLKPTAPVEKALAMTCQHVGQIMECLAVTAEALLALDARLTKLEKQQ